MKSKLKIIIPIIGILLLVVGYYYYLSNKNKPTEESSVTKVSEVQNLLLKNLDADYPPTPKEVVKMYADITVAFYTEDYSEEEFTALADKILKLYDYELVNNTDHDTYLKNLRNEIDTLKASQNVVSSYAVSSATDVEYFSHDKHSCAKLNLTLTVKNTSNMQVSLSKETFILRKDFDGHWKIYGWTLAKDDDNG